MAKCIYERLGVNNLDITAVFFMQQCDFVESNNNNCQLEK